MGNEKMKRSLSIPGANLGAAEIRCAQISLTPAQVKALRATPQTLVPAQVPNPDGTTAATTCRFENAPLTFDHLSNAVASVGVVLVEIPSITPTYTLNSTQTRFPSAGLPAALLSQVQELIPVVKIQARATGYPAVMPAKSPRTYFADQLSGEPPLAQKTASRLCDLAANVRAAEPWSSLSETNLIAVQRAKNCEPDFISVLGAAGEHRGFFVYPGIRGYAWTQEMISAEPQAAKRLLMTGGVLPSFSPCHTAG